MMDKAILRKLKEKGVDASIILDLLLEEDESNDTKALPEDPAAAGSRPENSTKAAEAEKPVEAPKKPAPDPVLEAINKLTGAVQAMNRRGDYVDSPGGETTDDILSKIIT